MFELRNTCLSERCETVQENGEWAEDLKHLKMHLLQTYFDFFCLHDLCFVWPASFNNYQTYPIHDHLLSTCVAQYPRIQ